MAPHDFLDGQWDQPDRAPPPGRSHRPARPARSPQGGRGRLTGAILALAIVVILAATAIALWTPREDTRTPIEVAAPTEQAPGTAATSEPPEETTTAADAPPDGQPAVEQIITRWATRDSAEDESWSDDLSGHIAPDAARRLATLSCLPLQSAPLRVDGITPEGEPVQDASTWSGDLTVTVTDSDGAQTPVTVRAQAAWNEPTTTWMLTGLECLASGGAL